MTVQRSPELERAIRRLWARRAGLVAIAAALFCVPFLPWVGDNAFTVGWALTSAMVGLSMNVLVGYAGQISLAQAVFYGSGAFAIGNLASRAGLNWLVALPLAGVVTALIALVIGFPALRIRGLHLAIATLGFQFVMQRVVFRWKLLTGGAAGVDVHRPEMSKTSEFFAKDQHFLWIILASLFVLWVIDRNLTRSRAGRAFFAIRQDEQVAMSFGIPVSRYKLLAFAIAGFYAGIAGALFGTLQQDVTNEIFDYIFSFQFLVYAVLGGLGSRPGTSFASAFPIIFNRILQGIAVLSTFIGGTLLMFTLIAYPGGLAQQWREGLHVAQTLTKRGAKWGAAFAGAFVASIAMAFALPWAAARAWHLFGHLAHYFLRPMSPILGIFLVIIGFAGTNQLLARWLLRASGAATQPVDLEKREAELEARQGMPDMHKTYGVDFRRRDAERTTRAPLLEIKDLAIRFGGVRALDGVSMEVRQGELIGIMGPNGSGKTTMLNCVSGFLTPNEGQVLLRGESILDKAPHERAALGLGRTFQNIGLVKPETVFDNFLIAQHLACSYGPMEGLLRTTNVMREERRLNLRAQAAIEMLGLRDIVKEEVRALPHGRAKLVELGCALVTGPELLLLDEPAAGVSPQEADALGQTLKDIAREFGVTILMIEHHVPLMLQTCDYIYALNFGRMLTSGAPAEVAAHPDVIESYLGSVGKEASVAVSGGH
jgi:ABC-type branched-subunit amino acid transport system ATPase component/ABC-type branched-subunit amino acid transport system permease subunit